MANTIDLKNPQVPAKKEKKDSIGTLIDAYKDKFAKALPATITPERFARIATTAIAANPALAKCSQTSLIGALLQSASVGLEPNSPLGQAYLIPYNGECQFQISYKGIIELAHRSGQLKSIEAHCVHENDMFEYELGLEPKLKHIPAKTNRGSVIWVYAIYHLNTGGYGFEVMSREDINAHRKRYSKARTSPWDSAWEEMAKKTVIKKVLKYAPMSSEFVRATAADEHTLTVDLSSDFDEPTINEDYIVEADYTVDEDGVVNEPEANI